MIFFLGVLGILAALVHFRGRMVEWDPAWSWGRLLLWGAKGVGMPLVLFLIYCNGMGGVSPPWIAWVAGQSGMSKGWAILGLALRAGCVIVSFWGAITFLWFLGQVFVRVPEKDRDQFAGLSLVWGVLTLPFWLWLCLGVGWVGAGLAVSLPVGLMVHATLPLIAPKKRSPLYARAIGQIKMGKFDEAENEVIRQLETCDEDFEGWMLLGELYAVHFQDVGAAEETVAQLIQQETITDAQVATALHQLAQWQLGINLDPEGARLTLLEIVKRLPDTNMARMAQQRVEQLPVSREEMQERQKVRAIHMPAWVDPFAAGTHSGNREDAAREANSVADRLGRDPNDVDLRETFAWLLAERIGRVDLAFDQLQLLQEMPGQAENKRARWLAMAAAWELRHREDRNAAQKLMKRLVNEYPGCPEAFAAQRRLKLMEMEDKIALLRSRRPETPKIRI